MDENNSLDQMITEQRVDTQPDINRPRLRKIKRPKIRPSNDLPVAPDKVSTEDFSSQSSVTDSSRLEETTSDISSATDLIAPRDVSELLQERQKSNPYVLEALPPDFDNDDMLTQDAEDDFSGENKQQVKRKLLIFSLAFFLVGVLFHAMFFSSPSEEKYGLEGVTLNQDVPAGRPRCGLTERSQACVFYLMNCYKQELTGRDFYKLAAQLTGRAEYSIETVNLHYATVKIRPGYFAQINIPPLD